MIDQTYELSVDLAAIEHLGEGLYSTLPAALAELVANSYDADANSVWIDIDPVKGEIKVRDNGDGMSKLHANSRFLNVGYHKRDDKSTDTVRPSGRHVMGRKGIGKLAIFYLANSAKVFSIAKENEPVAFEMRESDIIASRRAKQKYHPPPLTPIELPSKTGTLLVLTELKKRTSGLKENLSKRIARRFGMIGLDTSFKVFVDGVPVTIEDRDYFDKLECIWYFGLKGQEFAKQARNARYKMHLDISFRDDLSAHQDVWGWIGTVEKPGKLDEGQNAITVLAWDKIVHEDILKDIRDARHYKSYIIGEVYANFLDADDRQDIVTSNRQSLQDDDGRYASLRAQIRTELLNKIEQEWNEYNREASLDKARQIPAISHWFDGLRGDHQPIAKKIIQTIEAAKVSDDEERKQLYRHGILAFESLALKNQLKLFEDLTSISDPKIISSILESMDNLEDGLYSQIIKERLNVLKVFEQKVNAAEQEKVIRDHVYNHPWLLDPSWERGTTVRMEKERAIKTGLDNAEKVLTREERESRFDIKVVEAADRVIIIELKRADRLVDVFDLMRQSKKYVAAIKKSLLDSGNQAVVHCICLLGKRPRIAGAEWTLQEEESIRKQLNEIPASYKLYDELIASASRQYSSYLDGQARRLKLLGDIDTM
jgi:hypothetical protein